MYVAEEYGLDCRRGFSNLTARKQETITSILDFTTKIYLYPHLCLRNKSWKPECVGSFNMDWRILVFYPEPEARDKIY
jgi:hypothetical protein